MCPLIVHRLSSLIRTTRQRTSPEPPDDPFWNHKPRMVVSRRNFSPRGREGQICDGICVDIQGLSVSVCERWTVVVMEGKENLSNVTRKNTGCRKRTVWRQCSRGRSLS